MYYLDTCLVSRESSAFCTKPYSNMVRSHFFKFVLFVWIGLAFQAIVTIFLFVTLVYLPKVKDCSVKVIIKLNGFFYFFMVKLTEKVKGLPWCGHGIRLGIWGFEVWPRVGKKITNNSLPNSVPLMKKVCKGVLKKILKTPEYFTSTWVKVKLSDRKYHVSILKL